MKESNKPSSASCIEYDYTTEGGGQIYYHHDVWNCKLTIVDYCHGLAIGTDEQTKKKIDDLLVKSRIAVYLNTNIKEFAERLAKNYQLYSFAKVPIGYGGGYQYHIVIRNTLTKAGNSMHMRPIEQAVVPNFDKETARQQMVEILKKKRRKTDIADDLIKVLG